MSVVDWMTGWLLNWGTLLRLVMLLAAGVLVWSTLTAQGRTFAKTLLFVPSLIPGSPIRPINLFTETPTRTDITFSDGETTWSGDLYLPSTKPPHPGIVVALGVNPAGRNDERVVRLGEGLARMGLATLVPHSENLINKTLTPQEIDFTVASFQYLESRPEVDPERVGFLGVCVGSSLSLLAAQDERIRDQVNFVNWFGGYYRLEELIVSVATHSYELDGLRVPWTPDRLTDEVVKKRLIEFVDEDSDRQLLRRALIGHAPLSQAERAGLSPTGTLVEELFQTDDPARAHALLARMPPEAHALLRLLSPATNVAQVKARVFVMDDSGDNLIPYVHSRSLADALDEETLARHSKFSVFSHVDLNKLGNPTRSVPELWALFRHTNQLFQSIR